MQHKPRNQPDFLPDKVGSAWNASAQVDVVGISRIQKTLILGECKWTLSPIKKEVLSDLVEKKTASITPKDANWQAAGMRLLDLEQVDNDLARWSGSTQE